MAPEISTALNRPHVPAGGTKVTARVDVEPGEREAEVERHIGLCIDTSGSMSGDKIKRARDGARWVCGLLEPDDYLSITAFDSEAELVLPPTRWGDIDPNEAADCVKELSAGGKTDMYDGIQTAKESLELLGEQRDDAETQVRRILVLSDGKDKYHDPEEFEDVGADVDEAGIRVEAAGIGDEYNEKTIRTLGTTARGEWTHLEGPGDIEEFFGEAVEQASEVVAPDAQLELDVAEGVGVSEVYRALPQAQEVDLDWESNTAVVKLPDLTERESQQVVMKMQVPPKAGDQSELKLADVTLTARGGEGSDSLSIEYTEDNEKLAENNEDVQLDHRTTVIKTELGKGNVETAETQVEKMTRIHGEETEVVEDVKRETEMVKEGGRAERNRATKVVDEDDGLGK